VLGFKKIKVDEFLDMSTRNKLSLSEIYGKKDSVPEFAILSPDGKQIGTWMKCKDYIQDTFWAAKSGTTFSIYGWVWNHVSDPHPSHKKPILSLRWRNKEGFEKLAANTKRVVESLEKDLKIPLYLRTRFSAPTKNKFIVFVSPLWVRASWSISFFTWLLRASLMVDEETTVWKATKFAVGNDAYYRDSAKKFYDHLKKMGGLQKLQSNWDKISSAYQCHESGVCGWANNGGGGV